MPTTTKEPRTLTPEQKAKMALGKARKDAIAAGLPDPFPLGVPGTQEFANNQPANAPALTQAPAPATVAPAPQAPPVSRPAATLQPVQPEKAPEPIKYGPHDIVRVFNPDNEDFNFRYGTKASYDGKGKVVESTIEPIMYTLPAGKAIPMHGYMADYVCNHLTSRILQKNGQVRQLNSPIIRKAWATKIILGKEDIITPEAKLSEAEQVQAQFNKIQIADQERTPVTDDESEIPLAEADALLSDIDNETLKDNGEFPDAKNDPLNP